MRQYSLEPQKCFEQPRGIRIESSPARQHLASVTTYQDFCTQRDALWDALMFYEDVPRTRPFLLRRLLPTPVGSEGCKSEIGGEVTCHYLDGHLVKRVTQIVRGHNFAFEIIEQNLALKGIRLLGGEYTLSTLPENRTRIALTTRYSSPNSPRWLFRYVEVAICHSFHHYILAGMRSNLSSQSVPVH